MTEMENVHIFIKQNQNMEDLSVSLFSHVCSRHFLTNVASEVAVSGSSLTKLERMWQNGLKTGPSLQKIKAIPELRKT